MKPKPQNIDNLLERAKDLAQACIAMAEKFGLTIEEVDGYYEVDGEHYIESLDNLNLYLRAYSKGYQAHERKIKNEAKL